MRAQSSTPRLRAGAGDAQIGVGDAVWSRAQVDVIAGAVAQTLGEGEQHIRIRALSEARDQHHGQGFHAKERRELAFALPQLMVGKDADRTTGLQALVERTNTGTFSTSLFDVEFTASA